MKEKIKTAIIPALLLAVTFGVCGPIQMYLTNVTELWFSIFDIWWMCMLVGIGIFGVCAGIGILLPEKVSSVFYCLIVGISLGLYIQGNFINTDYGILDGHVIDWSQYTGTAIINTLLWLFCVITPVICFLLRPQLAIKILRYVSVYIIVVQMLSLGTMLFTTDLNKGTTDKYVSKRGLFEVSQEGNVVVFILDSFDQEYFEELYQTESDFLKPLEGFTYFDNATSMYPTTNGSLPYILTGKVYKNEQAYPDYVRGAYEETDYYRMLKENGYEIGLYTDDIYVSDSKKSPCIDNLEQTGLVVSSHSGLTKTLYKFTAFRYFPHLCKQFFWFYSGEFDAWKGSSDDAQFDVYSGSNILFYNELKTSGLQLLETGKSYKVIHLSGTHLPHTMNEDVVEVTDGSANYLTEAKGSLNIVYEYIQQLKALDLYDDTTFVLTADHGEVCGEPTAPILLVKRAGDTGELKKSKAPVCHGDLMATIMTELQLNHEMKYGRSVFDIPENEQRVREYLYYTLEQSSGTKDRLPPMREYVVDAESNDLESFHLLSYDVKEYKLGTNLSFQEEDTAKPYSIIGMSPNEISYTWTSGKQAIYAFQLDQIPEKNILAHFDVLNVFNDTQTVIASVNGTVLYEEVVQGKSILEFIIPNDMLTEEPLKLVLDFPDACSPQELGLSGDVRSLALSLTGMRLEETDLEPEDLWGVPEYRLGTELTFTDASNGMKYFTSGISSIENDFVWSNGSSSVLTISFTETVTDDLEATFKFKYLISNDQQLIVRAGENILYDAVLTSVADPVVFTIPRECVQNRELELILEYPNAICPAELGTSTDKRTLSVAFSSIVVDYLK